MDNSNKPGKGTRKDALDPTLSAGDQVLCRGGYATVTDIRHHAPGKHDESPVRDDWAAVEIITVRGSRWYGRKPTYNIEITRHLVSYHAERCPYLEEARNNRTCTLPAEGPEVPVTSCPELEDDEFENDEFGEADEDEPGHICDDLCAAIIAEMNEFRVPAHTCDDSCLTPIDHECTADCTWLDGDKRELEAPATETVTPDADDLEWHDGSVIVWAADHIWTKTDATEPSVSPVPDTLGEHEWLSGAHADPYEGDWRVTETTVRLTGDWTPEERAQVFDRIAG